MIKKVLIILSIILFTHININAQENRNIEIFDINKGKVIDIVQSTPDIQAIVEDFLNKINGIYTKCNPIPDKGSAIKIPLDPPIEIHTKSLNTLAEEVIIMYPEDGSPFLLIFENETNLVCYTFEGDANKLLEKLGHTQGS